ncbi:MAG: M50 family metallopeptidase [Defluviitaleaceae bacterium]|nr:M50 family metallopeptidase [Defluviitaleaceae bacterium]
MDIIIGILIFILILGVVISVHELGHFLAARHAGIFVEEFALGMGPKIFSFKGKKEYGFLYSPDEQARTLYSLRAFPIGGFCRLRGMDDELSDAGVDDPLALNNKSIPARALVMAGGSLMNFALAFLLFFALMMLQGYPVIGVYNVEPGMPAYEAGLLPGDVITHINGDRVGFSEGLVAILERTGGRDINLRVNRDGTRYDFALSPVHDGERYRVGVSMLQARTAGLLDSRPADPDGYFERIGIIDGFLGAGEMIVFHIRAPFRLIAQFVTREPMPEEPGLMGPIGIGSVVVDAYQVTSEFGIIPMVLTMVFFTALLNAALGIMNLLPIPALDGARLVFLAIEAIRRKPIAPEKEAYVHIAGMVLMIVLAIFIAYQDIVRLTGRGNDTEQTTSD